MGKEEYQNYTETKPVTIGTYKITGVRNVALYPSGKTWNDHNPTQFTDFDFIADFGEGHGKKVYTVRAPGNVYPYGRNGVVEVIKVSRSGTSSKFALIYNPSGSFIQIATFLIK